MQDVEWNRRSREGRESFKDPLDLSRLQTLKSFLRWNAELKDMAKNGFHKCLDELCKTWQKCTVAQGSYFEGECVLQ
ncbi:hypothetical protein TNCV_2704431 [Trichonephila clavipes]|nr:hypothetical protein TNCV_2704431 [Trichonephila clavipes]